MKNIETIYAYGDYVMKAEIEEKPEDIHLCIGYTDHGDEFIYVQTKDGCTYTYGFWCNRNFQPDYDYLLKHPTEDYVRLPKLFKAADRNSTLSNSIYRDFNYYMDYSNYHSRSWDPGRREWEREYKFKHAVELFQEAASSGIKYDWEAKREIFFEYLKKYDMDTPDNLKIVEELPMSSRVNGFDGIAAKKIWEEKTLYFDDLNFVIKDGVEMDTSQVAILEDPDSADEWGFYTSYLILDQFEDDAKEKMKNECLTRINEVHSKLDDLSAHLLDDLSLKELVRIRSMISNMLFEYYIPDYEEEEEDEE